VKERCPQCGSDQIIPEVPLLDRYHYFRFDTAKVEIQGAPQAWVFKDAAEGQISLSICGVCGHAEVRVSNAPELWERYQQARSSTSPRDQEPPITE